MRRKGAEARGESSLLAVSSGTVLYIFPKQRLFRVVRVTLALESVQEAALIPVSEVLSNKHSTDVPHKVRQGWRSRGYKSASFCHVDR